MAAPALRIRLLPKGKAPRHARRLRASREVLRGPEMQAVLRHLAEQSAEFMRQGIRKGRPGWPPLSEITKALKGSERKLVETGGMELSIETWRSGPGWAAGIPGRSEASLRAGVHEEGAHVPVSDEMRRFFAAKGFPLRAATRFLRIPPRPWLAPAVSEVAAYAERRLPGLMRRVVDRIGG